MANCQKNTDYLILDSSGQQVRDIGLSSDGKSLEITVLATGNVECTFNIDDSNSTGLLIDGDNFRIVDSIDGLTQSVNAPASTAKLRIERNDATSRLEIIGIDDIVINMQANIRYDAATDKVIMHY